MIQMTVLFETLTTTEILIEREKLLLVASLFSLLRLPPSSSLSNVLLVGSVANNFDKDERNCDVEIINDAIDERYSTL